MLALAFTVFVATATTALAATTLAAATLRRGATFALRLGVFRGTRAMMLISVLL